MPSILVVDNLDSFTFTLVDYLASLGADVRVVRSNALTASDCLAADPDGFLISPGPGHPADAGLSVELAKACIDERRPLLGVCLGHQAIGLACGGEVGAVEPVHGKTGQLAHDRTGLFEGLLSPFTVTRYHSLALTFAPPPLRVNATGADGTIQGVRHDASPVHGVQFHPESVASEHGHALLGRFLALCC